MAINNKAVFDKFINQLDDLASGNYTQATDSEIDNVVINFINKLKTQLEADGTEASGRLSASIAPLPVLVSPGVVKVRVELESYWRDVNDGTKPKGYNKQNMAQLLPSIRRWVQDKPSLQQMAGRRNLNTLSYVIARKILKKGTIKRFGYKGSGFVTKNMDEFKNNIIKAFENAYKIE